MKRKKGRFWNQALYEAAGKSSKEPKGKKDFIGTGKTDDDFVGDSDLLKAVKLLEENGFYVVHADTEQYKSNESNICLGFTGALLIRAYPKRYVKKIRKHEPEIIV